jgi:pimeloyl-ACP methyl ester carboxylesterase
VRKSSILFFLFFASATSFAQKSIDTKRTISIGGIKQLIWVKGDDATKPIFLFLHGGPGNSVMPYAKKFCDQLYKHFVVVHWDQREAGETAKLNVSPVPLSVNLLKRDAEELVDSLLFRFKRKQLFIAGHSWGTMLGFHLVRTKPEKITVYIAIGAMVNQQESERIALNLMTSKALETHDTTAQRELQMVQIPFQNGEQLYYHRKGLYRYAGNNASFGKKYVTDWAEKWLAVFNEASAENLFETLPAVNCPVYFFGARKDFQTNSKLVEKYFNQLKADKKQFFWFENAGHNIPSANGAKMQAIIINEVLKDLRN